MLQQTETPTFLEPVFGGGIGCSIDDSSMAAEPWISGPTNEYPPSGICNESQIDNTADLEALCRLIGGVTAADQVRHRARELLHHYVTFEELMRAAEHNCHDEEILTFSERMLLRSVKQISLRVLREKAFRNPILNNHDALHDYLRMSLARERSEVTRLILLDGKYRLLADELHSRGTINHTPLYLREMLTRVLAKNAKAVVIVHNHPTGDPKPSTADVRNTLDIARMLAIIDVELVDHVVVGLREIASLKKLGIL